MNALYDIGLAAYALGARAAALRPGKARLMVQGQAQTLDKIAQARRTVAPDGFDLWMHAASLGEFEQGRPMLERLRRERPGMKVLLTFFSPSGYEVRKAYDKADCVAYLPFDTPARVAAFLDAAAPKMAIFVKYEFWGNYLQQLAARGIPAYLISGIFRPGQHFFKWWGAFMRPALRCFSRLYVQDERSASLLASIGITDAVVAGDTRFDRVTDVMRSTVRFPIIEQWQASAPQAKTIIAGSSWQPDEDCYIPYLNNHQGLRAIIAPHEFDARRLQALKTRFEGRCELYSECEASGSIPADTQVVIIDSFGKLSSLYRYGCAAIIGGGLGAGIHNINEAAVYGMPVLFGPNNKKFKEAAEMLQCGGGFQYADARSLASILDSLVAPGRESALKAAGEKAGKYISDNLGATDRIYKDLFA